MLVRGRLKMTNCHTVTTNRRSDMTDELRVAISKWKRGVKVISIHDIEGRVSVRLNDVEISSSGDLCGVLDGLFLVTGDDVEIKCMRKCIHG